MTVQLSPLPIQRFYDNNNVPLSGGLLYTYAAGTNTPQATYTDGTGSVPNSNPVVLNARGEAAIWITYGQSYKFVLTDSSGNQIWTADNVATPTTTNYIWCGTAGGTPNALTITPVPPISAYVAGQTYSFITSASNTGAATLSVSGLAAKSITKSGGTPLIAGDILNGAMVFVIYDGTQFQLTDVGNLASTTGNNTFAGNNNFTGSNDFTAGTLLAATQTAGDASTKTATTSFVGTAVSNAMTNAVASRSALVVSTTGLDQKVSVTADELILQSVNNVPVVARYVNLTGANAINLAVTGVNGIDTGTVQPNTWYAIWILEQANGVKCGVASTATTLTGVTLPSGYTFGKRIGMIRTDATASPNSKPFPLRQEGNLAHYVATAASNMTALPNFSPANGGISTSMTTYIPTAVTSTVIVNFQVQVVGAGQSCQIGPSSQNQVLNIGGPVGTWSMQAQIRCESNSLYTTNTAATIVYVLGWIDNP